MAVDPLKNMHLFVEVARFSSFRGAADALQMPSSTVSRRIAELERNVGLRLFNRTTRRVELTEAGRSYFENCKRIIDEAQLAHQALLDSQASPSGVIRASMPVDFSVMYLSSLLAEFARQYPGISFGLDLNPTQVDLISDGVDLVIRIGQPRQSNLIARKIAELPMGLFASPRYLAARGLPQHPQDLLQHECLRMRDRPWLLTGSDGRNESVAVRGRFVVNNFGMLRQLVLQDGGIMAGVLQMEQSNLEAGLLVPVLPQWQLPVVEVYALTTTRLISAKVRLLIDFLIGGLRTLPRRHVAGNQRIAVRSA